MSSLAERESASEIDAAAAAWAIRLEERGGDPTTAGELEAWVAGDPRRAGALLRAEAALCFVNRGRALAGAESFAAAPQRTVLTRRTVVVGGGVAGLAAAAVALFSVFRRSPTIPVARYKTLLGEVLRVPLADGTVATLNTASEIEIVLTNQARSVSLIAGEALFEVAKDRNRPFVVSSGPVRARAVGTAFTVRRRNAKSSVLVTEGIVDTWVSGARQGMLRLAAGSDALVSDDGRRQVTIVNSLTMDHMLAWRTGEIVLAGLTVAGAAEEFNRYNSRKLLVADSRIAQEKLVGRFRTDQPEAFADAVASTLGAVVNRNDSVIRISGATPR